MICTRCGATYVTIVCPDCIERVNRESMLRRQPPFLARAFTGQLDLILVRKQQHKPHVQLYGDEARAFCGEPLTGGTRNSVAYNLMAIDSICRQCATVIADLMNTTVEAL
jgi:hypothetical protein